MSGKKRKSSSSLPKRSPQASPTKPTKSKELQSTEPAPPDNIVQSVPPEFAEFPAEVQLRIMQMFAGPIPPPQMIEDYERILPGAADRLFSEAEKESKHRRDMGRRTKNTTSRGQWFALVYVVALIGAVVYCVHCDAFWVAGVLGGSSLIAVAGLFLTGKLLKKAS